MVFDPEVPREHAVPIDLAVAPELVIVRALRPNLLPSEAFSYLAPQRRAIYYFGSERELA